MNRILGQQSDVQCHVLDLPATNAAARAMRIDGFPALFFDNDEDRQAAHGSPEMAACNIDSRQFIGAVSRVIADVEEVVPLAVERSPISLVALFPDRDGQLPARPGMRGLLHYRVREQGAAPDSTVPHLPVTVGAMAQAWFGSVAALEAWAAALAGMEVATFVVEEHWLTARMNG